jgi:CheY-like chemotaxis protein
MIRSTVLICDDEPRLAALTAGLLEQSGYAAQTALRGEDALRVIESGRKPDALLLDVNLTGLSASNVLRRMREENRLLPVILTSGYAEEDVDPELLRDPLVAGYLAKPYTVQRLIQAIQHALSSAPYGVASTVA